MQFDDDVSSSPMAVTDRPWLYIRSKEIASRYPCALSEMGKWMLFYDNENIDEAWERAKALYLDGRLRGISSMKVATNVRNPRASSNASKVIIFYCGPASRKAAMLTYGQCILDEMRYSRQKSAGPYPSRIYYKTDVMTMTGTAATGQKKNHLYSLEY